MLLEHRKRAMKLKIYTGEEVRALRQKLSLNQSEFWAPFQTTLKKQN